MTSIEQLQLCGIRSFDPNPVNKQSVEFHKPLTVILGKNGSGKTTIIEALLNACTGSMPPGSGTEKSSFVYDPKVIGESEVKAQIRLLFTGRGGKAMQVIRSFQVTRHRQKTSFSTLDNTVAYQDAASGKVVSSTYRASDVDRVIPEMLGVSPAVLEHVLFCHQEDCNWPLDPPKNVKRIFDDIFAATRYVLALDRLRENSKEFRRQQKEHEASLMALREHRDQAKQLESDIEKKEGLVVLIQNRSKSLEPDMQELRKASSALDAVEQNIEGYSREAAVLQGRIGEKRDAIARMGFSAPKESVDELRALQQEAADRSQGSCEVLQQCQEELRVKEDSSRSTEEKLFQLRSQVQVLERDQQQHQGVVAELSELLRELSNEGITYDAVSMDEGALAEIQQRAHASLTAVRTHRDAARAASGREVEDVDARRQALLRTLEAETREVDMLHGLIRGLAPQRLEAEKSMKDLGGVQATEQLEACRSRVHQLEARVEAAMKLREKGERHQRRERVLEELKAENVRVARLRQQLSKEKQRSGREEELTSMRHQLCQREDRLAEALAQHVVPQLGPLLIEVSDATSLNDIVAATQHERRVRSDRLLHIQHTLSNLERQEAALQQRKECLLEEYTLKEDELGRKHGACKAALGDMDLEHYDRHLREAKDNYERHRQQHQSWTFMHSCRSDYAETAKRDNKCQVCERPFATEQEALRFIEAQKQPPTASVPTSEDICESARETLAKLERVQQTVDEVRQLQQWIPGAKQTIQQLNAQLEQTRAELADEVQKLEAAKSRLSRVEEVAQRLSGMSMMESEVDGLRMQLKRREQQLNDLEREVRVEDGEGQGPRRSFDDLSDEYEEAFRNVDQLNLQLSELQRMEKDEGTDTLDRELQSCRGELHQAELAAAKAGDVQATLSRLCREEEQHRSRLQDIGARQSTLQAELKRLEAQLQTIQEVTKETDLAEARLVEATENTYRRFEMAASKLRSYWTSLTTHQLQTARMNLAESEALRDRNATEVGALREKLRTIQASMEDHRHRMSEIDRSLLRREQEDLLQEDEQRLAQVEHSLSELKGSEVPAMRRLLGEQAHEQPLPRLRELIRGKLSELEKLRAQQEGHVEASMQEINNLKAQMGKEKYHNIEKRYRSTFLKVQTTEIAVKDIEKYYNALEKAVQSYHQEKIAQINLIISDLWRQTYRGSDIDTVEIRSETDTTTTTAARRSYNYRVIMKRGTTEVDMRGRCSAGQKVLASVIIRLALSEAFCCECGILALDEPTTNLDEDNARSLAEALRVLIETRRTIKHFQLIVITHDEQFVRALGGQSVESFYYVHKDRDGAFSLIEKRTFHQLFT